MTDDGSTAGETPLQEPSSWLDGPFFARALDLPRVTTYHVAPAVDKGDNYASVVYRCTVSSEAEVRNVVVKCLPSNPLRQQFANKTEIFRKERDIYTKVLPRYEAMLSKVGPPGRSFPWPKYHSSGLDGKRDYIVLQDLSPQGFSMARRMQGLDADHLALVLAALGEFHACSVAWAVAGGREEFAAEVALPFRDLLYVDEAAEDMGQWVRRGVETAGATVGKWGDAYAPAAAWISAWADRVFTDMRDLLRPADGALLCHGDAWLNNMLFRLEQGGRPAEVKLLDFQLARYSSPATDLLYLMVTSTTAATRRQHWAHLLEHEYLRNLWKTLESLGVRESIRGDVYSTEWLRREMRRLAPWTLFNGAIVLRAVVLEAQDAVDLDTLTEEDVKSQKDFFQGSDDSVYQERFRDLVNELSDDGLFDG